MVKTKWLAGVVILGALGLSLSATGARAQAAKKITVDARGGYAIPLADAKQLWKAGPNAGIGVAYWFNSRIAVRIDGEADFLSGRTAAELGPNGPIPAHDVPNLKLYHFGGGLEWLALDPATTKWRLSVHVGVGGTHLKTNDYPAGLTDPAPTTANFSKTYVSGYGGLRIGYQFQRSVGASVGTQVHYILTKSSDFRIFPQFDPTGTALFNDMWTMPIQGEITIHF